MKNKIHSAFRAVKDNESRIKNEGKYVFKLERAKRFSMKNPNAKNYRLGKICLWGGGERSQETLKANDRLVLRSCTLSPASSNQTSSSLQLLSDFFLQPPKTLSDTLPVVAPLRESPSCPPISAPHIRSSVPLLIDSHRSLSELRPLGQFRSFYSQILSSSSCF